MIDLQKEGIMTQTETSKAKVLFVEVPMDAMDFKIDRLNYVGDDIFFKFKDETGSSLTKIPQGNWQILNTLKDVSDLEMFGLTEKLNLDTQKNYVILYELKN